MLRFSKYFKFLLLVLLLSFTSLQALTFEDNFNSNSDGWYGDKDRSYNRLYIEPRDGEIYKTYSFGNEYANVDVEIQFDFYINDEWENNDDVYFYINDDLKFHIHEHGDEFWNNKVISGTTDANGDVEFKIETDNNRNNEWSYIDNVEVTADDSQVASVVNDICYKNPQINGSTLVLYLQNNSEQELDDVQVVLDVSDISGNFLAECGINGVQGNCQEQNNVNIGGSIDTFSKVVNFNPFPDYDILEEQSLYVESSQVNSLFDGSNLYAKYDKDGSEYQGRIKACQTINENYRDFSLRKEYILNGSMKTIGNTVLVPPQDQSNDTCDTYEKGDNIITNAGNTNAQYYLCNHKEDIGTTNSTQADLNIPDGSTIKWVGLYWQALVDEDDEDDVLNMNLRLKKDSGDYFNAGGYDQLDYVEDSGKDGYISYSAFKDVTYLFNANGWQNDSATFTVADIPVEEGKISVLGTYGAWTMVVIYENTSDSLKSFSVYDGWKLIQDSQGNREVNVDISGFMTPLNGEDIDSTVSVFAAEGDKNIENEKLEAKPGSQSTYTHLTNESGKEQTFNSSITTQGNRVPELINNNGIDIQLFDLGSDGYDIMENGENNITFKFTTTQDTYWPSLIAFETQLYEPRVCYVQEIVNPQIESGDTLEFDIYIKNEPEGNETLEDAQGVQITTIFDENLEYTGTSYDYLSFDGNDTITYWVGDGASMNNGGTLEPNEYRKVEVNATIDFVGDINLTNQYFVSYRNDFLGLEFKNIPIGECQDFNTSISVLQPPTGVFNVVHDNADMSNGDPVDGTNAKNDLHTQITAQAFNVDVVALEESDEVTIDTSFVGKVFVEVVNGAGIDASQESCDDANDTYYSAPIIFTEQDNGNKDLNNVVISNAIRDARFRIGVTNYGDTWSNYKDTNESFNCQQSSLTANLKGVPQCLNSEQKITDIFGTAADKCLDEDETGAPCESNNHGEGTGLFAHEYGCADCLLGVAEAQIIRDYTCSRDNFAVRPNLFDIDATNVIPDPMIAGTNYTIQINALDALNANDSGYDQNISNIDTNVTKYFRDMTADTGGILAGDVNVTAASDFVSGISTNTVVSYSDVGAVDVVFVDSNWAEVDNDDSTNPNGLDINGTLSFRAIPDRFVVNNLTLDDHDGGAFTYLSNDTNVSAMSAKILYNIDAVNANNDVTQNYSDRTTNMWEQNVTIDANLLYADITYADQNATFKTMSNVDIDFVSGTATAIATDNTVIEFNFDRDPNVVHEPFTINGAADLNVTNFVMEIEDTDSVDGNSSTANGSSTFYYGHLYAPDIPTPNTTVNANIYTEVFCENGSGGTNCAGFGLNTPSVDRMNWWHFTTHQNGSGDLNISRSLQTNVDIEGQGQTANLNTTLPNGGLDSLAIQYTGGSNTYKAKIELAPSSWLSYHQFIPFDPNPANNQQNYFYINWMLGGGDWAGSGTLGEAVDNNATGASGISREKHDRINW